MTPGMAFQLSPVEELKDNRPVVRCTLCTLAQFAQAKCRRCKRPLPAPAVRERIWVNFGEDLPTVAELEMALIREALRRTNGATLAAAALIQMPRTTFVRKAAIVRREA